ncbi:MAG: PEP-CTERM sorting domain-containing protein [Rugosibacter sp.]|nr:PEP-CTERM sorting domain-containing protein [Rugosibacter sp.]
MKKFIGNSLAAIALTLAVSNSVLAGPIILGGDDLTDHGSFNGTNNLEGWLYIEKAISNLLGSQTRGGSITTNIAALGSASSTATSANAGAAIGSAASELGKTVSYFEGAAAINQFFVDLAAGVVNPSVIWLAGTGAANDLDTAEGLALTANALAINSFVSSGGGLMSHGSGDVAYGWLTALLPGLTAVDGCNSNGATLTAAGNAAFPGLSNSDVDANAGPCHNYFAGDFGGLVTLAFDGSSTPRSYIIGGGADTVIQCGQQDQPPCPTQVPEPSALPLFALAFLGMLGVMRRKQGKVN